MKRLFSIAIILLSSALAVAAQDIIGDWNGKLNVNGGELRLVLHITKNADGSLKGTGITEYSEIEETMSPVALEKVASWILKQPSGQRELTRKSAMTVAM